MDIDHFQHPLYTLDSRPLSRQYKSKNKSKPTQSPYLSKMFLKPSTSNTTPHPMNRPILSLTRKLQMQKLNNKFQNTLTNFETYKYKQNRFCDTVTNGFIMNERPVSKQQSRSRLGEIACNRYDHDELIVSQIDDFENSANLERSNDKVQIKLNRPQTSKGQRTKVKKEDKQKNDEKARKIKNHQRTENRENHIIENQNPNRIQRTHPSSAMERSKITIDDLIKVNTKPLDTFKTKKTTNLPFTSLIDHDFLSLFANYEQS